MPADITHESIAARLAEVDERRAEAERKAAAPFEKERASLQELCGGLGHVFDGSTGYRITRDGNGRYDRLPLCAICDSCAPAGAGVSLIGFGVGSFGGAAATIAINAAARDDALKALEQVGMQIDALQRIADGGITGPI